MNKQFAVKFPLALIASIASIASVAFGQQTLNLSAPPPPPVTYASGNPIGTRGGQPMYYWVIVRYPAGASSAFPITVFNTVGFRNFTAQNYVTLNWSGMPGATGYDLIRHDTNSNPALQGSCNSCAVAVNISATTYNDQSATASSYVTPASAGAATVNISLNNRDYAQPQVFVQYSPNQGSWAIVPCVGTGVTSGVVCVNGWMITPTYVK